MKLWIASYHHEHGITPIPLWCADDYKPTTADVVGGLLDDFEKGESVHIDGPMGVPTEPQWGA